MTSSIDSDQGRWTLRDRAYAPSARKAALAGAASAGVALGITELASGLTSRIPSLIRAVGSIVIELAPGGVVRTSIDALGTKDKPALVAGVVVLTLAVGALTGVVSRRTRVPAVAGLIAFGTFGATAAASQPGASGLLVIVTVFVACGAALAALERLFRLDAPVTQEDGGPGLDRRAFLRGTTMAAAAAAGAGLIGFGGRYVRNRLAVAAARADFRLPAPALPAPPPPVEPQVRGLSPLVTSNRTFYRIDTSLVAPVVDPDGWRLRVGGRVDEPYTLTLDQLLAMPSVEEYVTLACVSNEVGGSLVGTARWQGVPLRDVLERAGPRADATQVVGRSVDGFTAGFPTEAALDGRVALVAFGMNGEPLPVEHGFPARLVVAGLYGYVSATKWLSEVTLTRWEDFDAYWIPRGWAKRAPIKTQSRIDVPRDGSALRPGTAVIAGVAWAPTRGIDRVEVRIDGGEWLGAELGPVLSANTWRQWFLRWDTRPGPHKIAVRATDGEGHTQDAARRPPEPDGATGYHEIEVTVDPL